MQGSRKEKGALAIAGIVLGIVIVVVGPGCSSSLGTPFQPQPQPHPIVTPTDDEFEPPGPEDEGGETTPVIASVVAPGTYAVRGTDGRYHIVYELVLTNASSAPATIDGVTVLNAASHAKVLELSGVEMVKEQALRTLNRYPAADASVPASGARLLLLTATFAFKHDIPQTIVHQIDATALNPITTVPSPVPKHFKYLAASLAVSATAAPVVSPPLEGEGWLADDGCCAPTSHHVNAILPINGTLFAAERFGIDWARIDASGRIVRGDPSRLSDWVDYGAPVLAVADGVVSEARDGLKNQTPLKLPERSLKDIPGNDIVIDLGNGFYAFYAYLKPGSVKVRVGEHVRAGELIGQVGNSGGSTAPHLHFHLVSGMSPVASDGVPYAFNAFDLAGQAKLSDFDGAFEGKATFPTRAQLHPVPHKNELPLSLAIVDFPTSGAGSERRPK